MVLFQSKWPVLFKKLYFSLCSENWKIAFCCMHLLRKVIVLQIKGQAGVAPGTIHLVCLETVFFKKILEKIYYNNNNLGNLMYRQVLIWRFKQKIIGPKLCPPSFYFNMTCLYIPISNLGLENLAFSTPHPLTWASVVFLWKRKFGQGDFEGLYWTELKTKAKANLRIFDNKNEKQPNQSGLESQILGATGS